MAEAYIVAAARTAGGRKGGRLAGWHPADLAASVLDSLVDRSGVDPAQIEDVIMGCVMQAGEQSTNIARNAVMASKLPESVPATSVDRQCGSSQQALHFAAQAVMAGSMDIVIAAGVHAEPSLPFFVEWAVESRHPGRVDVEHSAAATGIKRLIVAGEPKRLSSWLDGHRLPVTLADRGSGVIGVVLSTRSGEIVVRSNHSE